MAMFISHSAAETEALGEAWGRAARRGLVIGLTGDLGTGKTQLVKGIARGLGITARVHSPTFTLVNVYPGGRLTLFHLDLYRLETPQQLAAAGLEEYLTPEGLTVIEWVERWLATGDAQPRAVTAADLRSSLRSTPDDFRWVRIEPIDETTRRISYEDPGS